VRVRLIQWSGRLGAGLSQSPEEDSATYPHIEQLQSGLPMIHAVAGRFVTLLALR
jgi:hypothetical protein